jgi:hypothetical protein
MTKARIVPAAITVFFVLACGGTADTKAITKEADDLLMKNDLPGAAKKYNDILTANPTSVFAGEGVAYSLYLQGDYDGADAKLADAEKNAATAGDSMKSEVPNIKLRRALVALRANKLDNVKKFGEDSGLPAGQVLAAEVHLADAESDEAIKLLKSASSDDGPVGETAKQYVTMLESDDPMNQGLAEATALWSLGSRDTAVEAAEELVKALPEEREDKNELLLVWASRAVTSGRPAIADGMLEAMSAPPADQAWRVQATKGMIAIANGENDEGIAIFTSLASAGAPGDGLSDALATAAALTKDPEIAKQLAGSVESAAAARGLTEAGATDAAKEVVPSGPYKSFLQEN